MYFSPKKHILSNMLLFVAMLRLIAAAVSLAVRLIMRRGGILPDLADETLARMQLVPAAAVLLITALIFLTALIEIGRNLRVIPKEERQELARLQEETFGERNAALPAETVRKLLLIWLAILVGAQSMYDLSAEIYRRFVTGLARAFIDATGSTGSAYASFYNLSHGFKYQGMLIALLLGAAMTGIFLADRILIAAVVLVAGLFMISAAGMEMYTLPVMGRAYGIVWSSVIFHFMETIGLIAVACYLRVKYHGV